MKLPFVFAGVLLLGLSAVSNAVTVEDISRLVGEGHWAEARLEIARELSHTNLSFATREALLFQKDRMRRMRLDFNLTREQVFRQARRIVPSLSEEMFDRWDQAGSVEYLDVDGTRWYFNRAAANLFLINPKARALREQLHPGSGRALPYRPEEIQRILANYDRTGDRFNTPRTWQFTYALSVKPGAVPPGETIRAWLPYPHAGNRQRDIRLISSDPPRYVLSNTNTDIASIYLEKPALSGQPTRFKIVFQFTSDAFYEPIDPARVRPVSANDPAVARYLGERPTQIVFSDEIRRLARQIVGTETNDYLKARLIFRWVVQHITWASAREYSTIECLPHYALTHGHGDCGIETLTFMTLCRFNGIPARWESGWIVGPEKDMHDWCEIYLAPYGWVPVDVYYGLIDSKQDREKWFYLGGIDGARFVVNTNYGQPLYPEKTFFRSEIVDFQRGEAEWRGGNLYFDKWSWNFQVKELTPARP